MREGESEAYRLFEPEINQYLQARSTRITTSAPITIDIHIRAQYQTENLFFNKFCNPKTVFIYYFSRPKTANVKLYICARICWETITHKFTPLWKSPMKLLNCHALFGNNRFVVGRIARDIKCEPATRGDIECNYRSTRVWLFFTRGVRCVNKVICIYIRRGAILSSE